MNMSEFMRRELIQNAGIALDDERIPESSHTKGPL